ncbi:LLM class flavin-dependent oxidoreductase [Kribbella jejuensis]|uniref:Alkanesulfonate monooxygenase SsuD/methylene tetrahydromethanopterin reductase-like flavin-dependent oxidoreductase (Luciferase family) n=1 Tax=Kribbella jejuensis TaxID=236068 RepID=A0A542DSY9_9ACTN|nr:LLM class flavin-dependent oxidoreductase [Kribbella jejuensis]TQJ06124.1 alkanesulfonate monooxygenase SsuD/methylene tetrahydromethanopterin reductase-like flavin-dependent oxidoreductase (luciferase family) [Kribbella jejuensis]
MNVNAELGVLLPTTQAQLSPGDDPRQAVRIAVEAEELGYDSVWANDSLLTPRVEALSALTTAAALTERVTVGTATLIPVTRRPVNAAHSLASLDLLSGGRLVVGVGAGFPGRFGVPLHQWSEVPWERRFARLDETVALWRQLWTADGPVTFHGELLHLDDVPPTIRPHTDGGPPIWLGGTTPKALERVARMYDGWLPYPPSADDYATGLKAIQNPVTPALFVTVAITDTLAEGEERLTNYARTNYGMPLEDLRRIQAVIAGPRAYVEEYLQTYVDAGARHLVCRLAANGLADYRQQLKLLAG